MTSEDHKPARSGPAALLAFFLAVMLGVPLPAASLASASPAGVRQLQPGKAAAAVRLARRDVADQADPTDPPPSLLGAAPDVETRPLSRRPSGRAGPAAALARPKSRHGLYLARAPPAA